MALINSKFYLNLSTNILYFKHLWKLKWLFYLGLLSFLLSLPLGFRFENFYAAIVGSMGVLLSIVSIYVERTKSVHIDQDYLLVDSTILNRDLKLDPSLIRKGYNIKFEGLNKVIESPKLNSYLYNGGKIYFEVNPKVWNPFTDISSEWKSKLLTNAKREKRIIFDSKKVKLIGDPILASKNQKANLEVQLTTYLQGFWTNEATKFDLKLQSNTIFKGSKLFIHEDVITPLETSKCANFIGISTLLIGHGAILPVVRQSARSAVANSKIAPSGSGSMDWEDIRQDDETFNEVICRAAERELREEMGLASNIKLQSQVIGYQRLMARGGKPEFFCVTWLENELESIGLTKIEKLFTHHADNLAVDWGESPKRIAAQLINLNNTNFLTYSQVLQNSLYLFSEALIHAKASTPFMKALSKRK